MSEYLMRDGAPFDKEAWKKVDEVVKLVAEQRLVGRRIISLFGPLGIGSLAVPLNRLSKGEEIRVGERELLSFTTLQQDFLVAMEDLVSAEQAGIPIDLSPVAEAASRLAVKEDELIFDGLRKARGAQTSPLAEWDKNGGGFASVAAAVEKFMASAVFGPSALVMSPSLYTALQRIMGDTGRLEIDHVRDLMHGSVYFSPTLKAKEAFLLGSAPYHMDLAVAQDMVIAYLGNDGLDHQFRLMEKLALRVKRPDAICILK